MTKQITIVGGGYGGLALIKALQSRPGLELTLIDRSPHHTVLTEVHQVAAGLRAPDTLTIPYAGMPGFRFVQAAMTGLDAQARTVLTSAGPVPYDLLVLALGSVDTDFGISGVREHALRLHSVSDALAIRTRVSELPPGATIAVAGGGLTGVELAGALAEAPDRRPGALLLLEGSPTLLPGLPAQLQMRAANRLGALGVDVRTSTPIGRVEAGCVHLSDSTRLDCDLLIWACGVKANPLIAKLGVPTDSRGRALVDAHGRTSLPGVYAIGDCAAGAPPTAQAACQQGAALATHLAGLLDGELRPLAPVRLKGTLVDLGHAFAVGTVGRLSLTGRLPALLKQINVARWLWRAATAGAAIRYLRGRKPRPGTV